MTVDAIRLKLLLQQRHWQTYSAFCREYDRVARSIDRQLVGTFPSRAQFHRWLSGEVKRVPHPHHCRVLEEMLPGWAVGQLFETGSIEKPATTASVPAQASAPDRHSQPGLEGSLALQGFSDVVAVYPTRSVFTSHVPPHSLYDTARELRIAGLSLNVLCQQYGEDHLRKLLESGASVRCLFLDPDGDAIRAREREEGYEPGHLVSLNRLNIQTLTNRVRNRLSESAQERFIIARYDETIRFNITLVDQELAVIQPYLHGIRGLEAPTFMLRNKGDSTGLFPIFERNFDWLWDRSTVL